MKYRIIVTFVCLSGFGYFSAATAKTFKKYYDSSEEDYGGSVESEDDNAATHTGEYYGNSKLNMDESWTSKSEKVTLKMQSDGNLVLYDQFDKPVWASETMTRGKEAEFRADGNFVVYGYGAREIWSSKTDGYPDSKLVVQDDGKVVIYHEDDPIWSSGDKLCIKPKSYKRGPVEANLSDNNEVIAPFGLAKGQWWEFYSGTLAMQEDGNLVLRNKFDEVIWVSNTKGWGSRAQFQEDGNFVIYSDSGRPVWSSGISGAKLVPQKDGNLVMYDKKGSLIWTSHTNRVINLNATDVDVPETQPKIIRGNSMLNRGESWYSETFELYMSWDGNLVIYDLFGNAHWNSGTKGKGWTAVFQIDGNFVVYSKTWKSVWESGTSGHPNATLSVQNDGNVVIYHECRHIWSARN